MLCGWDDIVGDGYVLGNVGTPPERDLSGGIFWADSGTSIATGFDDGVFATGVFGGVASLMGVGNDVFRCRGAWWTLVRSVSFSRRRLSSPASSSHLISLSIRAARAAVNLFLICFPSSSSISIVTSILLRLPILLSAIPDTPVRPLNFLLSILLELDVLYQCNLT